MRAFPKRKLSTFPAAVIIGILAGGVSAALADSNSVVDDSGCLSATGTGAVTTPTRRVAVSAESINYLAPFAGSTSRTLTSKLSDVVSVRDFCAVGNGSTDDYAAIMAAAKYVAAPNGAGGCLFFPTGTYAFGTPLVFSYQSGAIQQFCIKMDAGATLKYIGTSTTSAVTLGGSGNFQYVVDNLAVNGNGLATNGVVVSDLELSALHGLRVSRVSGAGILVEGGHTNTFYDPVVSDATYGMRFDNDASGTAPNNNTIINVNASRNSDAGLYFAHGGSTVVIGGTSEGNKGAGVLIGASFDNVFIGLDLESNGTYDYDVSGSGNTLSGGSDGVIIRSGAYENTITGQTGGTITLSNGSEWTRVVNAQVSANPSDSGAYDVFDNVFNFSTRAWLPTKKVAQTFSTLPTCTSGVSGIEGSMAPVTDSTTSTWGATITGGGSNHVLAYCDGSNWTVAAK